MARFNPTAQDLINLEKRLHEVFKRAGKGSIDSRGAYEALQPIVEGKFPVLSDPFARYAHLLLSLDQQLKLIREYNKKYWGGVLTEEMFAAINTESDHVQRVEDLEILHAEFATPRDTFEAWAKVIEGTQPKFWRGDSIIKEGYAIRLSSSTLQNEPGIHRLHINLVAHWDTENGRSVDNVREQVKGTTENLAHGEVFATYGLHADLLQATDGTNLPYFDAAGYEVKPADVSEWRHAPYLRWNAGDRRAYLGSGWTDDSYRDYAAPVVWV